MNIQPINHPAVWQGTELFDRDDWMHELNPSEKLEINAFLESDDALLVEVAPTLCSRLIGVQDSLENGSGCSLIRGLDVSNRDESSLIRFFEEAAAVIGYPISQSAKGERIFSVRNAGLAEDDPRARGPNTKKKLSFHTDRCDVIAFLCLKQAKSGGENQVVSSAAIFNSILERRPELLAVLMQPFFYQRHNVDTANELPYTSQPIFSFFDGHFASNFLRVLIDRAYSNNDLPNQTEIQSSAMDFLESVAAEPNMHVSFLQQPGDILLLNNWVTLHRRTAFEDHSEPELRRHILRAWLSMPNSRPLDPMFEGNYGATAAGAIRGGMRAKS